MKDEVAVNSVEAATAPAIFGLPLKYVSLVTLAVQNAMLSVIMHYSRVDSSQSEQYSAATAVLMVELLKGGISFAIAFSRVESTKNYAIGLGTQQPSLLSPRTLASRFRRLCKEIFRSDCWKLSIPAILYVIQNNLQYVAASNLEAATFQVTYQMKILTTAGFSVLLLRKSLSPSKWLALLFLAIGVAVVQVDSGSAKPVTAVSEHVMSPSTGFLAVFAACFTSGLAGVYFEMVLKNSQSDLWVRNLQLSLFSLIPAIIPIIFNSRQEGKSLDLFHNFGAWAWSTVAIQVLGGLITALVIKYADNILKGFATSLSIIISCLASVALFNFPLTITFLLGSSIVLVATWIYNQNESVSLSFGKGRQERETFSLPITSTPPPISRVPSTSSVLSSPGTSYIDSPREKTGLSLAPEYVVIPRESD